MAVVEEEVVLDLGGVDLVGADAATGVPR